MELATVPVQASSSHNTSCMGHVRWKGTITERHIELVLEANTVDLNKKRIQGQDKG